jgi:hypothetical protein
MARAKNKKLDKNYLISLGMKEALVDKLNNKNIEGLLIFAMEHSKASNLLQMLIQLASMEMSNKSGAIRLAANGVATPVQLKNLTAEQVQTAVDDYDFHEDRIITLKSIKKMLIFNQQEKLYTHTDGVKGEYFIDPVDKDEEDFA